jgi:glycosyltransferase involved in cell wall biosynthesis
VQITATDTPALAEALSCLATDPVLRQQAVDAGFRQARKFSWQAAAERLLGVYPRFG